MFRIVRTLILALVAAFAATAAAQDAASGHLARAVAATQAAKADYAFDLDLDTTKQNWRAHYDPNATPHLNLIQPRRAELKNDERQAFDRLAQQSEGVSWCASEFIGRVDDVRVLREDQQTTTYAFQPTPESIRGEQGRRFARELRGEMTITKNDPDITHVRLYTPAPFSPFPLVRVDRVNIAIACGAAPNGRRFAAETVTEIAGAAFGQNFNERSVQRARNLTPS